MRELIVVSLLVFGVSCGPLSVHAALITNGDFESTTTPGTVPDGWNASGGNPTLPFAYTGDPAVPVSSGAWAVDLGPSGVDSENGGTLFQTFMVTLPGTYLFSFDYTNEHNDGSDLADFFWSLSGVLTDGETFTDIGGGYSNFSRRYDIGSPGALTVTFGDIVGKTGGYDAVIDDVSFTALSVPIPSPSLLMLAGAAALMAARRRTSG